MQGLPPGNHKVEFSACGDGNFAGEFYDDKPTRAAADAINVTVGSTIGGINAELATGGKITGTVTGPGGVPLQGICVSASDSDLEPGAPAVTDANGEYAIEDLGSDDYRCCSRAAAPATWPTSGTRTRRRSPTPTRSR